MDWIQQIQFPGGSLDFLRDWFNAQLIFSMCQHVAIIFVIAFLFSKSKAFILLVKNTMRKRDWLMLYVSFFLISIMGSVVADQVTIYTQAGDWSDAIIENIEPAFPKFFSSNAINETNRASTQVDVRSIGAVLAGLLGGPGLGIAVGISSGIARYSMGGDAALAGALGTSSAGLIAGIIYLLILKFKPGIRFNWKIAFLTACLVELIMKGMVFLTTPGDGAQALAMIQITMIPNTLGNAIGVALFVTLLSDYDKTASSFSTNALGMAKFFAKILKSDYSRHHKANEITQFIQRETGIAAVAMTRGYELLAFTGIGADHHKVGDKMAAGLIKKAMVNKKIIFIDGYNNHFLCKEPHCPLHSALIVPVIINQKVERTLLLFETRHRFFPKMNRELGKGLGSLLAEQILAAQYPKLLSRIEDKYLRAKVNPHFFANALATISALSYDNVKHARGLLRNLAFLMRERIDPNDNTNTLEQELEFLNHYLKIEKTGFGDKLNVTVKCDPSLDNIVVPRFVLQLMVENAIKHGISKLPENELGYIDVSVERVTNDLILINIKDNAGLFDADNKIFPEGHGLKLVDDLIKSQFRSNKYGVSVSCVENECTIITLTLPIKVLQPPDNNPEN